MAPENIVDEQRRGRPPLKTFVGIVLGKTLLHIEWTVQYAYVTPMLLRHGVSAELASISWLFSPLTYLVLSPLLGRHSDLCTMSLGKRRPYLVVTAVLISTCLIAIPLSNEVLPPTELAVIVLIMSANSLLDLSNKLHDQFIRTLAVDMVVEMPKHQVTMQSVVSFSLGLGSVLGGLIGSVDYSSVSGRLTSESFVFFIATILFVAATVAMLVLVKEDNKKGSSKSHDEIDDPSISIEEAMQTKEKEVDHEKRPPQLQDTFLVLDPESSYEEEAVDEDLPLETSAADDSTWGLFRKSSISFKIFCTAQFFSAMGLWPVFIYTTAFFAINVFGGDESAEPDSEGGKLYSDGVRRGALAWVAIAAMAMIVSAFQPFLIKALDLRGTFCGIQFLTTVCLVLTYFIQHEWISVFLISFTGFAWAININSLPSIYIGHCFPGEIVGTATSIVLLIQAVTVVLVSVSFGSLIRLSGNDFATPFIAAAVFSMMAGIFGWFVDHPPLNGTS